MIIYCIRHGQATHNLKNIMNGDPRKPIHLTQLGRRQAEEVKEKLKRINFDAIYVSEFPRTQETAAIINNPRNIPVKIDKRLNDIRSGAEGKTNRFYKEEREKVAKKQKIHVLKARVGKGESFEDEIKRVSEFLSHLKKQPYKKVLIVAHYDIIQAIKMKLDKVPLEKIKDFKPKNCEIFKFKLNS